LREPGQCGQGWNHKYAATHADHCGEQTNRQTNDKNRQIISCFEGWDNADATRK